MNTTKTPDDQTTEEEPLNDVNDVLNQLAPHWRTIAGVAAVLITGFVIFGVISNNRKSAEGSSWASFFEAVGNQDPNSLQSVADNSSGTVVPWAHQAAAQAKLIEASQNLYTDRDSAKTGFEEAIAGFTSAVSRSENIPLLNQRSLWGLAQAQEGANELDKAKSTYQQLAERWPESAFAERATERAASLGDPETQEFYKWFFAQAPPSQAAFGDTPALPFDVPTTPDVSIPPIGSSASETPSATPITDALSGSGGSAVGFSNATETTEDVATETAPVETPVGTTTAEEQPVPVGETVKDDVPVESPPVETPVEGTPVDAPSVEAPAVDSGEVVVESPAEVVEGVVEGVEGVAPIEPIPAGEVPKPPH